MNKHNVSISIISKTTLHTQSGMPTDKIGTAHLSETIRRIPFDDPERNQVQERVAQAVEQDPEPFIKSYLNDPRSFNGRYVSADLFKETFPEYMESKDTVNRFNAPVHNSAAVLSAELFRRMIEQKDSPQRDTVIFLTGIPGAGKTSTVLAAAVDEKTHLIFEGQLAKPETSIPKIQQVLDAGFKPVIVVVHNNPETALDNTIKRFNEFGRGASINLMAQLQGNLPDGLAEIHRHFGDTVKLEIHDRSMDQSRTSQLHVGWQHINTLRKEGTYEHIKQRLSDKLEYHRQHNHISDTAYRQAAGLSPLLRDRSTSSAMVNESRRGVATDASRSSVSSVHESHDLLTQLSHPATNLSTNLSTASASLPFTRVAIIGVGLLGGSLALALKQHQLAQSIVGYGRNIVNLREAQAAKLIDEIATEVVHAVTDADLIVLATPVGQFADLLTNIAPYLALHAIVIDVGSTKTDVAEHFITYLPNHLPYCVPCHPIAGAEKSGWQHAQANLFMGRTTVICPLSDTLSAAQQRIMTMWQTIGSHCITSDPQSHDYTYGMVSHLPHLLAFAMMNQLSHTQNPSELLTAAGTGFRDFTRIAASHPQMWCDISLANRHNLLNGIHGFMTQLSQIQTMLQHEDANALHAWISHAAQLRRGLY